MTNQTIKTGLGDFSKEKLRSLLFVRELAKKGICEALELKGYTEVTAATLINIVGSCENPHASFTLNYYGREAHLSQSAQVQLEALVIGLKQAVFTVNNSFREENFDDPEAQGRRLSEFTLIEPERPYEGLEPDQALDKIIEEQEQVIKYATQRVMELSTRDVLMLGGDEKYLYRVVGGNEFLTGATSPRFERITYDEALVLLNKEGICCKFGDDLGILEERAILRHFDNVPTFVTHYPADIKFFNMKRTPDGKRVYSVDLLTPRLGETVGGAVREENGEVIKQQLIDSKIGKYIREKGQDPIAPFTDYFNAFEQEPPLLRGGYGIGFERFVGFLLQSNDILDTVAYRTLHPDKK